MVMHRNGLQLPQEYTSRIHLRASPVPDIRDIGSDLTSQTRLFADDCTVYREVNGKTDMQALQTDLNHLYQWSQTWQLSLNLSKCKAICISNKRSPPLSPYYINNVPLDWVDTFMQVPGYYHQPEAEMG